MSQKPDDEGAAGRATGSRVSGDGDAARGKTLTIICISIAVAVSVFGLVVSLGIGTFRVTGILRELLMIGLSIAVYMGNEWARWILGGLALFGAVMALIAAFSGMGGPALAFMLLFAGIYGFIGVMMFVSADIKAFQYAQRMRRAGS